MLTNEQIEEIREHLNRAQNPIFLFDNDIDGLMSFLILRRKINRGKGVAIKSFPELDVSYTKRVEELNADYVFILDKPLVSKEFFTELNEKNIPVVWIDHHDVNITVNSNLVSYYNPFFSKDKSNEPTSYIAYNIAKVKEDLWLAIIGCIGDNFLPEISNEIAKHYPELWKKNAKSAFEILYESDFGKIINILDFAMKDRTSNVINMINYLFSVKYPSDILIENDKNLNIIKRYNQVKKVYDKLMDKAKRVARSSKKVVFFQYSGELSLSADISNELSYRFPGKVILVAYINGAMVNVSIRGSIDVRKITLEAIKNIPGATGGGHKNATGAKLPADKINYFKEYFEKELD